MEIQSDLSCRFIWSVNKVMIRPLMKSLRRCSAIALAVKLNKAEMHDRESDVITINKVARVYSPWSSKIHGLTPMPERIRK